MIILAWVARKWGCTLCLHLDESVRTFLEKSKWREKTHTLCLNTNVSSQIPLCVYRGGELFSSIFKWNLDFLVMTSLFNAFCPFSYLPLLFENLEQAPLDKHTLNEMWFQTERKRESRQSSSVCFLMQSMQVDRSFRLWPLPLPHHDGLNLFWQ